MPVDLVRKEKIKNIEIWRDIFNLCQYLPLACKFMLVYLIENQGFFLINYFDIFWNLQQ